MVQSSRQTAIASTRSALRSLNLEKCRVGYHFVRRRLDGTGLFRDLFGRFGGLVCQKFNLGSDDGKSLAGIAGACRFDCRVERQQVRLTCNVVDQLDDLADLLTRFGQRLNGFIGLLGFLGRGLRYLGRFRYGQRR